jgi:hypothetical protein
LLAYVFFHRPAPGVEAPIYEAALRRFHASLAAAPPLGFVGSSTYRVGQRYSDWYLVESSAALDQLNDAAVNSARSSDHDAVAHMSADGAGKLLALVSGSPRTEPGFEIRFSKPAGMTYPAFYRRLKPWTGQAELTLWRRMMVLGPPPEFCLTAPSDQILPAAMSPESLARELI